MSDYKEPSEEKQKRVGCNVWRFADGWNCYTDCAFWNGKRCTYIDDHKEERTIEDNYLYGSTYKNNMH